MWKISEIKTALKDHLVSPIQVDSEINQVTIDSRTKTDKGLFIAFKGEFNDGHNFLASAFENGCVAAFVEKIPDEFNGDKRLILVKNCVEAFNQLAIFARNRTKAKIIGVTGSVGKTGVKEMLKTVFSSQGKTFANAGNFNNHFGLPLSLVNMPADTEFGIFEMGMNHAGEIELLSKMAKPHIAIITTVGAAHIGNFKNEEEIALAKSEIFAGMVEDGFVLLNADNRHFDLLKNQALDKKIPNKNIISFGSREISDVRLLAVERGADCNSKVDAMIAKSKQKISYQISSLNQVVIFNSLLAIACLELIGKNMGAGLESLKTLQTPKGRGNLMNVEKDGIKFTIIDDSYNANISSMEAGLKFLADLKNCQKNSRAIAFLGDMLELGEFASREHKAIANYISDYNIDLVLLVGDLMQNLVTEIKPEKIIGNFQNSSLASQNLQFKPQNGDIILVKGSRGIKMEKLIEYLQ